METFGYPTTYTAAANSNVTVNLNARPAGYSIPFIEPSYDAAPTGGLLTVSVGGNLVYSSAITAGGPGPRNPQWKLPADQAVVITLAAGGVGITGRLNITIGG